MSSSLIVKEHVDVSDSETVDEISDVTLFDPKFQDKLEYLSVQTDRFQKLETELDKARSDFNNYLSESSGTVKSFLKEIGSCIEKAKKSREVGIQFRELLSETNTMKELNDESMSDVETEKTLKQLQQELKKSINKSCLSTRRSLLQLNNLANQHQLQLLPYFEMKAQFKQMFEEQMKKVPPFEDDDFKMKMSSADVYFQLEESNDETWKFQDTIDVERSDDTLTKTSNSTTSSYQDSLSSGNLYFEYLTSEDTYMDLPPSIRLTPGLINCTVSCIGNGNFKSSKCDITDGVSFENLCCKTNHESFSVQSNGYECSSVNGYSNDETFSLKSDENFSFLKQNGLGFQHDIDKYMIKTN